CALPIFVVVVVIAMLLALQCVTHGGIVVIAFVSGVGGFVVFVGFPLLSLVAVVVVDVVVGNHYVGVYVVPMVAVVVVVGSVVGVIGCGSVGAGGVILDLRHVTECQDPFANQHQHRNQGTNNKSFCRWCQSMNI